MEKLKMSSPDMLSENVEKIAALFPNCVTETAEGKAIDFDLLKQELNNEVIEGNKERYRLEWPGKREAIVTANLPTTKTLRPVREDSVDFDNTENLYIEGDNLEVLKLLQESYLNKVKMIYIDPPYNTGNDFVYKDNFSKATQEELEESGQKDEYNQRLVANPETAGRYHSDWLTMMYPRLKLARNLLTDDGVIFISIDDNEVDNLRKLVDDVFGEINFINQISVKTKPTAGASGGGEDKRLKKNIEYVICYTKSRDFFQRFNDVYNITDLVDFIEDYRKEGKSWKYTRALISEGDVNHHCDTVDGSGEQIKIFKHQNVIIKTVSEIMDEESLSEAKVYFKYFDKIFRDTNAQSSIRQRVIDNTDNDDSFYSIEYMPRSGRNKGIKTKLYYKGRNKDLFAWLKDVAYKEDKKVVKRDKVGTLWDDFNWNNVSKEGDMIFPNGKKPIALIDRMLKMCFDQNDGIVLDFFSGSGSTAHAVMDFNNQMGISLKYIQVQFPENNDKKSQSYKEGLHNICEIGKERIRRAGNKIIEESKTKVGELEFDSKNDNKLDVGFRVYRLDESNMQDVYYKPQEYEQGQLDLVADNVKSDRTADDLLAQVMLDWGLPLSLKIEQVDVLGKKLFKVAENSLFACFDTGIDEEFAKEVAKESPLRIVFKDSAFKDDTAKVNVKQLLKQLSPETEMKVI
jgi:adenine-specific DNA-methyltransferase